MVERVMIQSALGRGAQQVGHCVLGRMSAVSAPIVASVQRRLHSYDEAIVALNSMQSNAEAIASARKRNRELSNVPRATELLVKSGVSLADLDALPIVHVSGTKGKGSTCAFLESILRHRGLRTGFFSSPHLVNATERIRLNGQPVSQVRWCKQSGQGKMSGVLVTIDNGEGALDLEC